MAIMTTETSVGHVWDRPGTTLGPSNPLKIGWIIVLPYKSWKWRNRQPTLPVALYSGTDAPLVRLNLHPPLKQSNQ